MKRLLTALLFLFVCFLAACSNTTNTTTSTEPPNSFPSNVASQAPTEPTTVPLSPTEPSTIPEEFENVPLLNVMSFNVYSSNSSSMEVSNASPTDMRIQIRSPKLNNILLGEQIHIAGLQEVNGRWQEWLNNGLDDAYSYVGTHSEMTGEGGYIVYRKDILSVVEDGAFWLAEGAPSTSTIGWDGKYDRLCSWAIFQYNSSGEYLLFLNTHMDHKGTLARTRGAKLILSKIEELTEYIEAQYGIANCPVILTGDMNAIPGSAAYKAFSGGLVDSFHAAGNNPIEEDASTSPGLYHRVSEDAYVTDGHRIDYVWVSVQNIYVVSYNMIHTSTNLCMYGEYISDHNAIISTVLITN